MLWNYLRAEDLLIWDVSYHLIDGGLLQSVTLLAETGRQRMLAVHVVW